MIEPIFMTAYWLASRYLAVRELPGGEDHPLIQWWLMNAGFGSHAADETPWCGAFVGGIAWELRLPRPALPARARAWLTVGEPVDLDAAEVGFDVVVLWRGEPPQPGPDNITAAGHVGFFVGLEDDQVKLLGGNQADKVSIAAYGIERVLGVRRLR